MASMMAPGTVPAEVAAFADEQGVTAYLPAMLEMTRRLFPAAPLRVLVEDDPEIADDRHIVFEVEVGGLSVPEINAGWAQWSGEAFQHCPSTHLYVFQLRIR
jgi:hypothetical protein